MRNFKRLAAMVSAVALAACAAAPLGMNAFAATSNKITVSGEVGQTHKYTVYQIFKGTAETLENGKITINGLKWANSAKAKDFISALKDDNCPIKDKCTDLTEYSTAAEVAKLIETSVDKNNVKDFAKFLETQVENFNKAGEGTSGNITITDDGWYLVIDDTNEALSPNGAYSSYLLQNVKASDGAELTFKGSSSSVVKKVAENAKNVTDNDEINNGYWEANDKYNDVADYSFGDAVPFRLEATLPSDVYYDDYEHYYLNFVDTLDKGFDAPTSLTVKLNDDSFTLNSDNEWKNDEKGLSATIGTDATTGEVKITVQLMDAKKAGVELKAGEKVTVDYEAVLNADAEVGRPGNYNDVQLEYSNNPKNTGDGTKKPDNTGTTEKDGVVVFTYGFDVHKYDGADETQALLAGAEFVVKNSANEYMCETTVNGKTTVTWKESTTENDKEVYPENMKIWTSNRENNITINGLDDGDYTLVEVKAPAGFNAGDPIPFKVVATTSNTQTAALVNAESKTGEQLEAIQIKYNDDANILNHQFAKAESSEGADDADAEKNAEMFVENNSGAALPGTGGIGTTIFYVGGGAMVAVAGVFLITKKRMGKKDE